MNKHFFVPVISLLVITFVVSGCNKENKPAKQWQKMHSEIKKNDEKVISAVQSFNTWIEKISDSNLKEYARDIDKRIKEMTTLKSEIQKIHADNSELKTVKDNYIKGITLYVKVMELYKTAIKDERPGLLQSEIDKLTRFKSELEAVNKNFLRLRSNYISKYDIRTSN
ncbi:MAG: hypothetical protein JXR95_04140 [Deltaproteobacteria bacterium]|nr:hypothetical protein [Deltaproteobacteria bacterium]